MRSANNNDDASKANDLCDGLTAKLKRRDKLIIRADGSIVGWETVVKYKADPMNSDSDDGKKIMQVKSRHSANEKAKSLTNLPFVFPVRDHQTISFGLTVNITASHPQINESSTSDFHQTTSPRMASFDVCNGPVASI